MESLLLSLLLIPFGLINGFFQNLSWGWQAGGPGILSDPETFFTWILTAWRNAW